MNRERDGKENAKHISMELTADGARVTSLSLKGSRLILTIEAELAESRLDAGTDAAIAAGPEPEDAVPVPDADAPPAAGPETPPEPEPAAPPPLPAEPEPEPAPLPAMSVDTAIFDSAADALGFAEDAAKPAEIVGEEDVMGGLPVEPHQPLGGSESVVPPLSASGEPVGPPEPIPFAPEPEDGGAEPEPAAPDARVGSGSISLADDGTAPEIPGFASASFDDSRHAPPPSTQARTISIDTVTELPRLKSVPNPEPGFGPAASPEAAEPKTMPVPETSIDEAFDVLGFAPAFQDAAEPKTAAPAVPEPEEPVLSLSETDNAWAPLEEPTPEKENNAGKWGPEPPLSFDGADVAAGAWGDPGFPKEESVPDKAAPAMPRAAGDWGQDVAKHSAGPAIANMRPVTETWDAAGMDDDAFPAVAEESSAVGGERHGEPQPAMSYGVSDAPPSGEGGKWDAVPQPEPEPAKPAPGGASPGPGKKSSEQPGSTTVLIRYTCPKCKTQGMQAVDKVGTVVNCSNCGKAMRLVMKK